MHVGLLKVAIDVTPSTAVAVVFVVILLKNLSGVGVVAGVVNENGSEVTEPALFVAVTVNVYVLFGASPLIHTGLDGVVGGGIDTIQVYAYICGAPVLGAVVVNPVGGELIPLLYKKLAMVLAVALIG